jgi:glucose dehydrogenase
LVGAALLCACGSEPSTDQAQETPAVAVAGWPVYGGNAAGTRYSPLAEIRRQNVARLAIAWTLHTGDLADARNSKKATFEATPILFDGTLYFPTPLGRVFAVDPETGEVRWRFDTKLDLSVDYAEPTSRGVAAWRDPGREGEAVCGRRLFYATPDARLFALDVRTGEPCPDFGVEGHVDLTRISERTRSSRSKRWSRSSFATVGPRMPSGCRISMRRHRAPTRAEIAPSNRFASRARDGGVKSSPAAPAHWLFLSGKFGAFPYHRYDIIDQVTHLGA